MRPITKRSSFLLSFALSGFISLSVMITSAKAASDWSVDAVRGLYVNTLLREPSADELGSWSDALDNGTAYEDIRVTLATGSEAVDTLTSYFKIYLRRSPEAGAIDFYEAKLSDGESSMLQIQNSISSSPEALTVQQWGENWKPTPGDDTSGGG